MLLRHARKQGSKNWKTSFPKEVLFRQNCEKGKRKEKSVTPSHTHTQSHLVRILPCGSEIFQNIRLKEQGAFDVG